MSRALEDPLLAEDFWEDPWPVYRELREREPVYRRADGSVVLLRCDDVEWALSTDALTSEHPFRASRHVFGGPTLLDLDGAAHDSLRAFIHRPFAHSQIQRLRDSVVRPAVERAISELPVGAPVDLYEALAVRIPFEVVQQQLALPSSDACWIREKVRCLSELIDDPGKCIEPVIAARHELESYLQELVGEASLIERKAPLGHLLEAEREGPDARAWIRMSLLLLVAATATTSCGIGNLIRHMQIHADATRRLTGPDQVKAFVGESLRIEPPLHRTARFCARGLQIRGVELARRTPVELSMGSASRDPERFPEPDRFDPSRKGALAPVFGDGAHACLGRSLALLELESVCELLGTRYELEPVGSPAGTCGKGLRRPVSLMMCLHPRASR